MHPSLSVHNFLSNPTHKQTNKPTDTDGKVTSQADGNDRCFKGWVILGYMSFCQLVLSVKEIWQSACWSVGFQSNKKKKSLKGTKICAQTTGAETCVLP